LRKTERILLQELCCARTFPKDIGMSKGVMNGEPGLAEILQLLAECTLFNGVLHPTYKDTCYALLEDDREWDQCLREASQMQTGTALRSLFAIILLSCFPVSPEILWDRYKGHICDDLRRRLQRLPQFQDHQFDDEKIYDYGLHLLNKKDSYEVWKDSG
jgi:hypothetical protein